MPPRSSPARGGAARTRPLRTRRGFTLVELVVSVSLTGIAFGAFALVLAQQERAHGGLARRLRARAQMIEGATALITDLRAVSPTAGDIPPGEARDSSIEFRATIGVAAACELHDRSLVIGLASFVTPPGPGDTAWSYVDVDGGSAWMPAGIGDVEPRGSETSPSCGVPAAAFGSAAGPSGGAPRYSLSLAAPPTPSIPPGTPIRVTRNVRYSLYRAPDARWYLGRREWSAVRGRFETIQPVSGPYQAYAPVEALASGFELRYFDRTGAEAPSGSPETARLARVVITLRSPPPAGDAEFRERRDVAVASVAFRNPQ